MTSLSLSSAKPTTTRADVLVIGAVSTTKGVAVAGGASEVADAFGRSFEPTLSTLGFTGRSGDVAMIPSAGVVKSPMVVVVGMGPEDQRTAESLRQAAGVGIRAVTNAANVAVALPAESAEELQAVAEGVLLGVYTFDSYRSKDKVAEAKQKPAAVVCLTGIARSKSGKQALETAELIAAAMNQVRDWVNTPARDLTPELFADSATAYSKGNPVKVTVWDEARLVKEECGGILGVGQGSANPPRLVQLSYKPKKPVAHIALVGKGITYDSGGLSLKTHAGLMTMKCDMAGAAAIIATTNAVARMGLPVQITAVAAMAENMVSGTSTRPGDVLTMRNGKTVEVANTDAEGRLVLADALVVAAEAEPDLIIDVATLTGACVVALGGRTFGVLSNDDALRDAIPDSGKRAGEPVWPLPIPEEMKSKVNSSSIADLRQHNPEPKGGALFAAAFLREFVGEHRWAHLDIAGPAFNDGETFGYTPKGGTGASVRTLVRFAQDVADGTWS